MGLPARGPPAFRVRSTLAPHVGDVIRIGVRRRERVQSDFAALRSLHQRCAAEAVASTSARATASRSSAIRAGAVVQQSLAIRATRFGSCAISARSLSADASSRDSPSGAEAAGVAAGAAWPRSVARRTSLSRSRVQGLCGTPSMSAARHCSAAAPTTCAVSATMDVRGRESRAPPRTHPTQASSRPSG